MSSLQSLELVTMEPGGAEREGFPLTVGVPFAKGVLSANDPVAILDPSGNLQPVQTRVMETHDDGSVRWLLLDYQSDFSPLGTSSHTLALGRKAPEPPKGRAIETKEEGNLLIVENGVLKLEIDRSRCRPIVRVWHDGELVSEGGLEFQITSDDGDKFLAQNDTQVTFEIEECGPMRLLMSWKGTHKDEKGKGHFDFVVRMTVYAGNPFIRIDHTLFNRLDEVVTEVNEVVARMPIKLDGKPAYTVSDTCRPPRMVTAGGPVALEQHEPGHFRIVDDSGKVLKEQGNNSMGWIDVSGTNHGLLLAGKDFWQNAPKAIAADAEAISCYLIPDRGRNFPIPRGMAKTHVFFLYFHNGQAEERKLTDLAYIVQRWPMPVAPSEHYAQSGELWDFFPYYPKQYPRLEAALRNFHVTDHHHWLTHPDKPTGRGYGLKHYGDYISKNPSNDLDAKDTYYLNNEYDTPHVLAMMFLRTKEIAKWWGAEAHALHMMDIDTCHHTVPVPRNDLCHDWKEVRDCQYRHCYQHIGSIQSPDETRLIAAGGSHTFAEGLLDRYHLTGDRYALDVAVKYAHHLSYPVNEHGAVAGVGRISGWALLVMGGVYRAQPHEYIRKAADAIVDSIIAQQQEDGGILEANIHPKAFEDRKIHLCMHGLIKWHQASGDEKVRKLIMDLMEGYLQMGLLDEGLPLYSNWPEDSKPTSPTQGFGNLESLAYAYDLTGDRRFIDAGIPGLCHAVEWITDPDESNLHSDNFQRILRGPFRFMSIAHELGLLEKVPGAGTWLSA